MAAEKVWECGDKYRFLQKDNSPRKNEDNDYWAELLKPLLKKDEEQCNAWNDEVHNLLLFSGLFSSILTAFVILSYQGIKRDPNEIIINLLAHIATRLDNPLNVTSASAPPIDISSLATPPSTSSIRISFLWFTSLVLSLSTALIGIVSLQWLIEHRRYPSSLSSKDQFAIFQMRAEGLKEWYVPRIIAALPLLLQAALILFFVGLLELLLHSPKLIFISVLLVVGGSFLFLLLTALIPAIQMFEFCFPVLTRIVVVPQCPYKSPQSRAFRWFSHVLWHYSCCIVNIFRNVPLPNARPKKIGTQVLEGLKAESWVTFDKTWLVMREAYGVGLIKKRSITSDEIRDIINFGPLYDLARGIVHVTSEYSETLQAGCLSLQDLTSSVMVGGTTQARYLNRYLQNFLGSENLTKQLSTFSECFAEPSEEFMQDENAFILLCRHPSLPPTILPYFAELHVRIMNYLYPPVNEESQPRNIKRPYHEPPNYPDRQLLEMYSRLNLWTDMKYGLCFNQDISEQFSLVITNFFEAAKLPNIEVTMPFYGQPLGSMFQYMAVRQPKNKGLAIMHESILLLQQKRDYLFYASSFYTRSRRLECNKEEWDEDEDAWKMIEVLHDYMGTWQPDDDLRKRLGIPVLGDQWWTFCNPAPQRA